VPLSLLFCAFFAVTTILCSGSGGGAGRFYAHGFVVKAPAFVSSVRGGDTNSVGVGVVDGPTTTGGITGRSVLLSSTTTTTTTTTNDDNVVVVDETTVPSWESLESDLGDIKGKEEPPQKPMLTLYRDTNGWCPFCERVWIAIMAKGIPYQETLVSLQNKPEWFKQMVPTGLVPAVLFHGDDDNNNNTSRKLVWESDAILYALDEMFPDTPRLMDDDNNEEFKAAMEMQNRLQSAGFKYLYGGRNETTTDDERQTLKNDFESVLDELDTALKDQLLGDDSGDAVGCFRLGKEFSGVDAMMIPTLERWRYQLPINENLDILHNRIHLQKWFDHLDSFPPYADRVAGDQYSWTAVTSTFLRYFGGGEDKPEVAAKIKYADEVATELTNDFISSYQQQKKIHFDDVDNDRSRSFAIEAVTKLITNHEAVVSDCVREEPLSQKHIPRASDRDTADVLLRYVASVLLSAAASSPSTSSPIVAISAMDLAAENIVAASSSNKDISAIMEDAKKRTQGALALKTVATRLSVPRDMGAPAASHLRAVLTMVAESLEK